MKFTYPAILRKTSAENYTGYFPDLEGCSFTGDTLMEAIDHAIEAASGWILVELEEDGDLPPISAPEDLELQQDEMVRNIAVTLRLTDGWDE